MKILNGFKVNPVRYMIKGRLGNFKSASNFFRVLAFFNEFMLFIR